MTLIVPVNPLLKYSVTQDFSPIKINYYIKLLNNNRSCKNIE